MGVNYLKEEEEYRKTLFKEQEKYRGVPMEKSSFITVFAGILNNLTYRGDPLEPKHIEALYILLVDKGWKFDTDFLTRIVCYVRRLPLRVEYEKYLVDSPLTLRLVGVPVERFYTGFQGNERTVDSLKEEGYEVFYETDAEVAYLELSRG